MPTYDYFCLKCNSTQEEMHSIKSDPVITCRVCESKDPLSRLISNNPGGFMIKGDTPSKLAKESRLRQKKNADLELRQIERYGSGPKLTPNISGVETDSWSDARQLAKESGISTKTYDSYVEGEKHQTSKSNVDDRKWHKAKEDKKKA